MGKKVRRLYEQFQPENYQLSLTVDPEAMNFSGEVVISGQKLGRPSQRLTFHQKELKITAAKVIKHDKKGDQEVVVSRINNQDSYDEVRLHSDDMIYPGKYSVSLKFSGSIKQHSMNGIYPCNYKDNGRDKKLIATQFESHHARQAFPCIDEPEAKATFDLTLTTPADLTALSNTPIKSQSAKTKQQTTTFETTPKMSTYLLAFVFGEMGYQESKTKTGVVVRSYAPSNKVELTGYSLDAAVRCLEFFEDYFGVPYPLPKLDMAALPDFAVGAMENWGLVTYRESVMLVDDKSSSIETKQWCALVVAHELSHQWFGNLVTMKWWDDLWLNESFANMMEYRAIDELFPEWKIWEMFVSHEGVYAKRRDSLLDVQAVHAEVKHPDEISTIFDPAIVYAKGGTLLRMLMHYIGEDAFRRGLKTYFDKHKYSNTVADDLWAELSASSSQDIGNFMNGWLTRPGYPLVTVEWHPGDTTVKLSQKRFLSDTKTKTTDKPIWQVPLASTVELDQKALLGETAELQVDSRASGTLLLNHDGQSYLLPVYQDAKHLQQITKSIAESKVDTIDRLLLLDNYILLQRGGVCSITDLMDLIKAYDGETDESVWGLIAMAIGEVRRLVEGDEKLEAKLDSLIQGMVKPLLGKHGWEDQPSDSAQTQRLRGLIYSLAAGAKHKAVIDEGLKRFKKFKQPSDLPPSTRSTVYYVSARYGSLADFDRLLALHSSVSNADERDEIAGSLCGAKDAVRYNQLIKLLTTDTVRRQDLRHWVAWLLRNRYSRQAAWQWLNQNWSWLEQEFSTEKNYGDFAKIVGSVFSRPEELKEFRKLFDDKREVLALARDIKLAEQDILSRIDWRKRNEAAAKTWLKRLT